MSPPVEEDESGGEEEEEEESKGTQAREVAAAPAQINGSGNKPSLKMASRQIEPHPRALKRSPPVEEDESGGKEEEEEESEDEEQGATLCGVCGDNYAQDEFRICCDRCEKWFHGKCVKIC